MNCHQCKSDMLIQHSEFTPLCLTIQCLLCGNQFQPFGCCLCECTCKQDDCYKCTDNYLNYDCLPPLLNETKFDNE